MDPADVMNRLLDAVAGDQTEAITEVVRRSLAGENVALLVRADGSAVVVLVEDGEIFQSISDDGRYYVFTHPDHATDDK